MNTPNPGQEQIECLRTMSLFRLLPPELQDEVIALMEEMTTEEDDNQSAIVSKSEASSSTEPAITSILNWRQLPATSSMFGS